MGDKQEFIVALKTVLRLAEKNDWYWLWPATPGNLVDALKNMESSAEGKKP